MNVKVLTKDERQALNDRYVITFEQGIVFVKVKDYGRTTSHSMHENILLNYGRRRIRISANTISIWANSILKDVKLAKEFTLIDVQNAVNSLKISYQIVDDNSVIAKLKSIKKKEEE